MRNITNPIFSEFQFQSIGKNQPDSEISLLKRISSTNASGSHEYDDQENASQNEDVDMAEDSALVPVETTSATVLSVPSRPTLLQTLGNEKQTVLPASSGPIVDIFGQKFSFGPLPSHPVNPTTSQSVITSPPSLSNEAQSSSSSSASTSKLLPDFPSTLIRPTISRASSYASNSSNNNLTYPFENTMSAPQTPRQALSPLLIKAESSRTPVHAPPDNNSSSPSSAQGNSPSPSPSALIHSSSGPSLTALKELHSYLLSRIETSSAESSVVVAQASAKLASAFEGANSARNLAKESYRVAQIASSSLVDSIKIGTDSHETAEKAITLVQGSMETLAALKVKLAKDMTEMNGIAEKIGGWIEDDEKRIRMAKDAQEKKEKEKQSREKEREASEAQEKEAREAQEKEAREAQDRETSRLVQGKDTQKDEELAKEAERLAGNTQERESATRNFTSATPDIPAKSNVHSSNSNSSVPFDVNESMSALDALDTLDTLGKADEWIKKLRIIEDTARRAREEKETQRDRTLEDKQRKEGERVEENQRRETSFEQEAQRRKEETERRQKKETAEEYRRKLNSEEETHSSRDAQKKKTLEERKHALREKFEQAQAPTQKQVVEEQRRRKMLQQSQVTSRKLNVTPISTSRNQRQTPGDLSNLSTISSTPSTTGPVSTASPFNSPLSGIASLPSKPHPYLSIPMTPNVIADQTLPKLAKNQRRRDKQTESPVQQRQTFSEYATLVFPASSTSTTANRALQETSLRVCQSPSMTQSLPSDSRQRSHSSNYSCTQERECNDGGASNNLGSPILHTDSADRGNMLIQSSNPKSPVVQAANRRLAIGARADSRQQVRTADSGHPISNANSGGKKKAARNLNPEYDIPALKEEEDEKDFAKHLCAPSQPTPNVMTRTVVPNLTSDLPKPQPAATISTKVPAPAFESLKKLTDDPSVARVPPAHTTSFDLASGVVFPSTDHHLRSGESSVTKQIMDNASGVGSRTTDPTPADELNSTSMTDTAAIPLPKQSARKDIQPSANVPSSSVSSKNQVSPMIQPPAMSVSTKSQPVSRGDLIASTRPPLASAPLESQSQARLRADRTTPGTSTRSLSVLRPAQPVTQARPSVRSLSPVAPHDGGWANVHAVDASAQQHSSRPRPRGYDHYSPSPNSPGTGRHINSEESPFIPQSPVSEIESPLSDEEQRIQSVRYLSHSHHRGNNITRNRRGRSTSVSRRRSPPPTSSDQYLPQEAGRGRNHFTPPHVVFQSRPPSPPKTYVGTKRTRLDRARMNRGTATSSNQGESTMHSHSGHTYSDSYTEIPASSYPSRFFNDSYSSLESRLSGGHDASGSGNYSTDFFEPLEESNDWAPERSLQSNPSHYANKRQKPNPAGSADTPALLSRLNSKPIPSTFKAHGGAAARGRGRGRGGTNHNSQYPSNNPLIDRLGMN